MIKRSKNGGFTLIELLVVIAIIGILSSVVLASLNVAREKGKNAKIKEQLANARSAASVFYDENSSHNGTAGDVTGSCATANSMFSDTVSRMSEFANVANYPVGTTLTCYSTQEDYAISALLAIPDEGNAYWCVDGTGASKGITADITGPAC